MLVQGDVADKGSSTSPGSSHYYPDKLSFYNPQFLDLGPELLRKIPGKIHIFWYVSLLDGVYAASQSEAKFEYSCLHGF